MSLPARIDVIDSHTGGEPTRVLMSGGPDLGSGSLFDRRVRFATHHDPLRRAVALEPRGSDVVVGAILTEPTRSDCTTGVVFFNNVGVLNMCVHGTIGVMVTLHHLGKAGIGAHRIETPVGIVSATLHDRNRVTVTNVRSYRHRQRVEIDVPGEGVMHGDVAWGGNWFFLVEDHGETLSADRTGRLTDLAWRIRRTLERDGITGADGGEIDHIELFAPPSDPNRADSQNFVLCPGGAYDRSPCGTGTSAKLACLAADGKLLPGETWRQESIIGSIFEGTVERPDDPTQEGIIPSVTGFAFITAESTLLFDSNDPFRDGIPS